MGSLVGLSVETKFTSRILEAKTSGRACLSRGDGDRLTGRKGNLPFQKPLLSFRDGFPVLVLRDGSSQRKK